MSPFCYDILYAIIEKWTLKFQTVDYKFLSLLFINKQWQHIFYRMLCNNCEIKLYALSGIVTHVSLKPQSESKLFAISEDSLGNVSGAFNKWLYVFLLKKYGFSAHTSLLTSVYDVPLHQTSFDSDNETPLHSLFRFLFSNDEFSRLNLDEFKDSKVFYKEVSITFMTEDWDAMERCINLNSEECSVFLNTGNADIEYLMQKLFDDDNSSVLPPRIIAKNTKKLILRLRFWDAWGVPFNFNFWKSDTWRMLLLYIIAGCQEAEVVDVSFSTITLVEKQAPQFIEVMKWMIDWFVCDVLPYTSDNCNLRLLLQFGIDEAVYEIHLTELKTVISSSFFSLHQFELFFNIFEPLLSWFLAELMPKMRYRCELQCNIKLVFPINQNKMIVQLESFARTLHLDIIKDNLLEKNKPSSFSYLARTVNSINTFEIFWFFTNC